MNSFLDPTSHRFALEHVPGAPGAVGFAFSRGQSGFLSLSAHKTSPALPVHVIRPINVFLSRLSGIIQYSTTTTTLFLQFRTHSHCTTIYGSAFYQGVE